MDYSEPCDHSDDQGQFKLERGKFTAPLDSAGAHIRVVTDWAQTSGRDVVVTDSGQAVDVEIGLATPVTVTGQVFRDLDGDGRQDPGEDPMSGVVIFLDSNGDGIRNGRQGSALKTATSSSSRAPGRSQIKTGNTRCKPGRG